MLAKVTCVRCGNVAWTNTNQDQREPYALRTGEGLCHRCWSQEWHKIGQGHISALRGNGDPWNPRKGFTIEEYAGWDSIEEAEAEFYA